MDAIRKMLYKLKDNSLNFIVTHKIKILSISLVSIGLFSLKILYDYQQEEQERIYTSVDESQFFVCENPETGKLVRFGLNRSPQNRDNGNYSSSSVIVYKKSTEGRNKPFIKKAITDVRTDFIYIWTNTPKWDRFRENKDRPVLKLNRLTGNLHRLEDWAKRSCPLMDYDCFNKSYNGKYQIMECKEISERKFNATFDELVKAFEEERKF